jgi:protein AroM
MLSTVTFVTIGQTPRTDLIPELVSWLPTGTAVREVGALDGLSADAVAARFPADSEPRLVTRLADGTQAVVGKAWMATRLQEVLDGLEPDPRTLTVLLCTGELQGLRGPPIFLDAQHLVDHGVEAVCGGMSRIGLMLPLEEQAEDFHWRSRPGQELHLAHASPYQEDRFEAAGSELAHCDVVVMHCMGYAEEHRRRVVESSDRPVLLARRIVGATLAQLL